MTDAHGWPASFWGLWDDLAEVRARLAAGADPDADLGGKRRPLHLAAEWGSADVVAELAAATGDIDAVHDGRTPLWIAVQARRADHARVLAAAGADPWRPMMGGWSPGRLSLAGPTPDLFEIPPGEPGLSPAEAKAAREGHRLVAALGRFDFYGGSLCCVCGVTPAEAIRRLDGTVVDHPGDELVVGVTAVPGGCVVSRRSGFAASTPGLSRRLSGGTVCYAMYANPKSGNQGHIMRDGVTVAWDLHPGGGWSAADDPAGEILRTYLFRGQAVAYCCSYAGLRVTDPRPFTGTPDCWVRLPDRDWWAQD